MSRVDKDDLIYKALADHRRREILDLLKDDRKSTGQICAHFKKLDRCTVMLHLGVLEKAGFQRAGEKVVYGAPSELYRIDF